MPPDKSLAQAKIGSRPLEAPIRSDENAINELKEQVLAGLRPGSQSGQFIKAEQNALLLNNNPTIELIVSYEAYGQRFNRSVLIANTPTSQIRFQLTARKSDFDLLYNAFRRSILTWEWQPEPEQPAAE